MGRFYSGDVCGKFCFAVQSSYDVNELVSYGDPEQCYIWKSCNCDVDEDNTEGKYCTDCYDSIDDHIAAVVEEENYEDGLLYTQEQSINYSLDKDTHYQELLDSMNKLKLRIHPDIIVQFAKIEQNDKILDAFSGVFDNIVYDNITYDGQIEKHEALQFIARYTLGYQIEYCLRMTGSCNINCEC
jgi:hypothetical protein